MRYVSPCPSLHIVMKGPTLFLEMHFHFCHSACDRLFTDKKPEFKGILNGLFTHLSNEQQNQQHLTGAKAKFAKSLKS